MRLLVLGSVLLLGSCTTREFELPRATASEVFSPAPRIAVLVRRNGRAWVREDPLEARSVTRLIGEQESLAFEASADGRGSLFSNHVGVRADARAHWSSVLKVLDLLGSAGFYKVSIVVKSDDTEAAIPVFLPNSDPKTELTFRVRTGGKIEEADTSSLKPLEHVSVEFLTDPAVTVADAVRALVRLRSRGYQNVDLFLSGKRIVARPF